MRNGKHILWWTTIFLISLIPPSEGIIGYDCAGASTNITTVSLLGVGECNVPQQDVNITKTYIQLIQINEYADIKVQQCKVEIYRTVRKCGMFSHTMDVPNGQYGYVENVSREQCLDMYRYGTTKIGQTIISGIIGNQTISRPIIITGSIDNDGKCEGNSYSDPYGTWDNVVVQGSVKISLRDYTAQVNVDNNRIHLRSGTNCNLSEGRCIDFDGGDTYWDPIPEDSCKTSRYGLLYEGKADKIADYDVHNQQDVYSLTEGDVTFALTSKNIIKICGYTLIRTEHPKLLIVETEKGNPFIAKRPTEVTNLDIFTYMNSKFVFVEKHIRTQIKDMYRDILTQRCNLERQILQTTLTIARISPDEFAFDLMKGPGYMAILAGEVAHIAQCIPVEVKLTRLQECYNELPVKFVNKTFFLTPRTHILMKAGTEVSCNQLLAPMYRLMGHWYSFGTSVQTPPAPTVLKPLTQATWNYVSPYSLATSGIYTQTELEELRDHLMFPAERPAILNSVARGITGRHTIMQGGSISNLLDEEALHKIVDSAWDKTWEYAIQFGNISAGVIGIMIICKLIKLIIDTFIHGYALHMAYGWSLYLLGAIWDSVTNLLLHLSRKPRESGDEGGKGTGEKEKDDAMVPLRPPPSYETYAVIHENPRETPIVTEFTFDPRLHEYEEVGKQTTRNCRTLPHPKPAQENIPLQTYTLPRSIVLDNNAPSPSSPIYDTLPKPRRIVDPAVSRPATINEKPTYKTVYPDLRPEARATDETPEPTNPKTKQSYFLLQKQPKNGNA